MNLQPVLDEMKQAPACHPVLVEFYKTHGYEKANAVIGEHWRAVQQGRTTEFKWLGEE